MNVPTTAETVVVGAGHAGLTMSWFLREAGRDHIVLERRASLGGCWQDRWDRFRLVSPNWTATFPGDPYDGPDPDGFMTRDEIIGRVAGSATLFGPNLDGRYLAERMGLPIREEAIEPVS